MIERLKAALAAVQAIAPYVDQLTDYSKTINEWPLNAASKDIQTAMNDLQAVIAEMESAEPVAWGVTPRYEDEDGFFDFTDNKQTAETLKARGWKVRPLYAQPKAEPACPACNAPGVMYECIACSASNYPKAEPVQEPTP